MEFKGKSSLIFFIPGLIILAPLQTNGIAPLSTISLGIDDNVSESCKNGNKESSLRTRIKLDEERISMLSFNSNDFTCFIFGKLGSNEILFNSSMSELISRFDKNLIFIILTFTIHIIKIFS